MAKLKGFEELLQETIKKIGSPASYRASFTEGTVSFNIPIEEFTKAGIKANPFRNFKDTGAQENSRKGPDDGNKGQDARYKDKDINQTVSLPSSSTIQQAAYWPERQYLVVSFKSGHTYDYQKVPLDVVESWENAASAGAYFYRNIRMSYIYRKMG